MDFKQSKLFAESWNIAIRERSEGDILNNIKTPFKILKNNFSSWCADPFIFTHEGKTYLFAELYDYKLCRGTIGYTILKDGKIDKWIQVIVEDYHLSYPFIFEHDDNIYIIPESSVNDSLNIYKAISFPNKWEKINTLLNSKKIVDTTFFKVDDQYYAFTTDVSSYDQQKEYLIKYNDRNVINIDEINVKDYNTSRMGGKVFQDGGRMIKVCQDCRNTYGGGLIFKEFSLDDLDGKKTQHILPDTLTFDKKILVEGIHTYNANDQYEIIDVKTRRFNILNFISRIRGKIK